MSKRGLIVAVVLVLLSGGIWIALKSSTNMFLEKAKETQSLNQMHMLAEAVVIYSKDHGNKWPDQLSQVADILGGKDKFAEIMHNPLTGDFPGYEYVKPTRPLGFDVEVILHQLRNGQRDKDFPVGLTDTSVQDVQSNATPPKK